MSSLYNDNKAAQVYVVVTLSILIMADLIGNSLVILIILRNNSMKSPMNYLLVNLAVADIMVGLFLGPFFILNHLFTHPDGLAGKLLCNTLTGPTIAWVGQITSCLTLVAISVERYFAIVHPFSVRYRLSLKKVKIFAIGSWIFALVFNTPSFIIREYDYSVDMCLPYWPESKPELYKAYSFTWFFLIGVIPIAIMFFLYSRVIYTLWFKQQQAQVTQLAMLKSRKRVTKMFVIVSVVYAVCIIPNLVVYFLSNETRHYTVLFVITIVLIACNSTINPFIYSLQSASFRRHLIKLMCCKIFCRNRIVIQSESLSMRRTIEKTNEHDKPVRLSAFTIGLNQIDIK